LHGNTSEVLICAEMSVQISIPAVANHAAAKMRRILVADDNRDAAETLAMLLRLDGHEVHIANDGLEAVEMFVRVQPEAVILDIGMPGLSGHEVARRIRDQHGDRPVILIAVTGWGQKADKDRAAASGFDHHFTKPVDYAALLEVIDAP
jgi:CheY-like chemotaxis protein